jgi:hypothetical protein
MTPKYFLLMAGDIYYPEGGTSDWIGCFQTYEEAVSKVSTVEHKRTITKGKLKGQEEITGKSYQIDGKNYDWWEVEDLQVWIKNGHEK